MTTRRLLLGLPLLLAAWVAVLAVAMRLGGPAPSALVVLPPEGFVARLPPSVAVTDQGALGLTLRSATLQGTPGLAASLYEAGAWLVLPAGLAGCLGLDA